MKKLKLNPVVLAILFGVGVQVSAHSATIRIPYNASGYSASALSGSTVAFDLGSFAVGMPALKTFTYTNTTSDVITITSIDTSSNVYLQSGGCSLLAPGESCEVTLAMNVNDEGANFGTAAFYATSSNKAIKDTFELNATGVLTSTVFTATPTLGTFSYYGESQKFTITNVQSFPITIDSVLPSSSYWAVTKSTCTANSLAPGASCDVTVKYNTTRSGAYTGGLKVMVSSIPFLTIPLKGAVIYGTASFDVDYLSFTGSLSGVARTRNIVVKNTGAGKLILNSVQMSGDTSVLSVPTTTCTNAVLSTGDTCTVSVKALFPTPNKSAQGAINFSVSNSGQSSIYLSVQGDSVSSAKIITADPAILAMGTGLAGQSLQKVVTISAAGLNPVAISDVLITGSGFSVDKSACLKTLNVGQSCSMPVTFSSSGTKDYTGVISVVSDADTPLTIPATASVAETSLSVNPSTVSFNGNNSTTYTQKIVVTNTSTFDTTVSNITSSGYATISNSTCTAVLTPSKQCSFDVKVLNPFVGNKLDPVGISYSSGSATKTLNIPVSSTITATGPALSSFVCPSSMVTGTTYTCSATLSNPSLSAIVVSGFTSSNPAFQAPVVQGSSVPLTLAAGQSKQVSVSFNMPKEGVYSSSIVAKNTVKDVSSDLSVAILNPTSNASATLTDFVCSTPVVGTSFTCTATLKNSSTKLALPISSILSSSSQFSLTHNCGTSLAASKSCVISVTTVVAAGAQAQTTVNVATNPNLSKPVSVSLPLAKFEVTAPGPVVTLVQKPVQSTVSFKNVSGVSVNLANTVKSVVGQGYSFVSSTCAGVLANNASCVIVSNYNSASIVNNAKGVVSLTDSFGAFSGALDTSARLDSLSVTRMPGLTTFAGFSSGSGNKYTVTNLGISPATLKSITTTTGLAISTDTSDASQCKVGTVLQGGSSCKFVESLATTAAPVTGAIIAGTGSVTTANAAVKAGWSNSYSVLPPTLAVVNQIPVLALKANHSGTLRVTNNTLSRISNISIAKLSSVASVGVTVGQGCSTSLAPGQYCDIPITVTSTAVAKTTATLTFTLNASFAKERNGVVVGEGAIAKQTVITTSVTYAPSSAAWSVSAYPLTKRGETNIAQHVFKNTGSAVIDIATVEIAQNTGTNQGISEDGCSGKTLQPLQECKVTTSLFGSSTPIKYTAGILVATSPNGDKYQATLTPNIAGEALFVANDTSCTGGNVFPKANDVPLFTMNYKAALTCTVKVKNVGSGFLGLSGAMVKVINSSATTPAAAPQAGFYPVGSWARSTPLSFTVDGQNIVDMLISSYLTQVPSIYTKTPLIASNDPTDTGNKYIPGARFYSTSSLTNRLTTADQYADGSFLLTNKYLAVAPGGEATIKVSLIPCSANSSGIKSWCYRDVGGNKVVEAVFVGSGNYSEFSNLRGFEPIGRFRIVANVKAPSMQATPSVSAGTTVLTAGQSVTFTYRNNDAEALPIRLRDYFIAHNYAAIGSSISNLKLDTKLWNEGTLTGDQASRVTATRVTNPINGQVESVRGYSTTGMITATNCFTFTPRKSPSYISEGESCYVRQSCLVDTVSGMDMRAKVNKSELFNVFKEWGSSNLEYVSTVYERELVPYLNETSGYVYNTSSAPYYAGAYDYSPLGAADAYVVKCKVPVK